MTFSWPMMDASVVPRHILYAFSFGFAAKLDHLMMGGRVEEVKRQFHLRCKKYQCGIRGLGF